VATTPVVEGLNVIEHIGPSFVTRGVPAFMNSLFCKVVEEALGDFVIPAVALAAHRTLLAVFGQFVLERLAGVLTAAVAVMRLSAWRAAREPRHRQRIDHDVSGHAWPD
jgi:hypothetical protein